MSNFFDGFRGMMRLPKNKALLIILPLVVAGSGCSPVFEQRPIKPMARTAKPKPPAPYARNNAPRIVKKAPPKQADSTYRLDNRSRYSSNLRVEPLTPLVETPAFSPDGAETPLESQFGRAGRNGYAVEDVRMPAGTQPAVVALLTEAERNWAAGDLDAAVVVTERALRIDSRNPALTYKLAQLRIRQNKPQLAEELAGKAALLAGGNLDLKRKSWMLIAEARRMQHDYRGADEARIKADSFFGR